MFWDPLFRYLQTKDPEIPLYMGSPSPGRQDEFERGTWFANGGPGYVLSRGAIKKLLHRESDETGQYIDPPFTEKWRSLLPDTECCGDSVLGFVMWLNQVEMQALYPMFTQHLFHSLPYDAMRWCTPIFTLHKTTAQQMRDLFRFEFGIRSSDVSGLVLPLYFASLTVSDAPPLHPKGRAVCSRNCCSSHIDGVLVLEFPFLVTDI